MRAGACGDGQEPRRASPFSDAPAAVQPEDAAPYCRWVGKRLPTLQEWQWAARGRDEGRKHPWGDSPPDFDRVCAVDGAHERGADRASLESGDPRIREVRSEGAWYGLWRRVADARGVRPLGESRDGLRDLIGNMREVVRASSDEGAGLITVGGSFRNYLSDHSEIVLTEGDEDEGLREFHERAMAALTVEGATIEGFEMRGDYGRLGIRCAADVPHSEAKLPRPVFSGGGLRAEQLRGLRRHADAQTLCRSSKLDEHEWTLPTAKMLDAIFADKDDLPVPYWTAGGGTWHGNGSVKPNAASTATARGLCVTIEAT